MLRLILCVSVLYCLGGGAARMFCPPPNFVANSNRPLGQKTSMIGEVHGQLWIQTQDHPLRWAEYFDGNQLARNLYFHIGMLGIDKLYLTVFYNETIYPTPPPIETIYPPRRFCVVEWYKLGVLEWRPEIYPGPKEKWPLDRKTGLPTLDRDYYKTQRGYHPIYKEIMNHTDWIFVQDMDELLVPVNFDTGNRSDWCSPTLPPLMTRILDQIQSTATRHKLQNWGVMMKALEKNRVLNSTRACDKGYSHCNYERRCKPITAIMIPIYLWIRSPHSHWDSLPTIRSIYPGFYAPRLKSGPKDGHEERWKAVYQTRHNPPLQGMSIHGNDVDPNSVFTILAPRQAHPGMSLELVHQRWDNHELTPDSISRLMTNDFKLMQFADSYHSCMQLL